MSKIYTAQEMRFRANLEGNVWGDITTAEMLRQAADALEREKLIIEEVGKIDTMDVALLDGHPLHQQTNTKRVAAILEFFQKVKEITREVKSLERENKYEFAVRITERDGKHVTSGRFYSLKSAVMATKLSSVHDRNPVILRRPVGEWEEVRDGE